MPGAPLVLKAHLASSHSGEGPHHTVHIGCFLVGHLAAGGKAFALGKQHREQEVNPL